MSDRAWWYLLIAVARPAMTLAFASLASLSHRCGTGRWPTISQWREVAETVHGLGRRDRDDNPRQ
jgi:hypothetical protein